MTASVKYFLSLVECAAPSIIHYIKLLLKAYLASLAYWVKISSLIHQHPFDIKFFVFLLQVPHMVTQCGAVLVLVVLHVRLVPIPPLLKTVGCGTSVGFRVPRYFLSYCGPVNDTCGFTFALHRAYPCTPSALAGGLLYRIRFCVLQHLAVVPLDCLDS